MSQKTVIVVGSTHLAYRVKILLNQEEYKVTHIVRDTYATVSSSGSVFAGVYDIVQNIDLSDVSMIYLLDEQDDCNLQFIIAVTAKNKDTSITAGLSNENIAPHLQSANKNLTVLNAAKIAAPAFVAALYESVTHDVRYTPASPSVASPVKDNDMSTIQIMALSFLSLIIIATVFFHIREGLSWIDSLYFVIVTVATVGYGDINLAQSSAVSKLFDIGLIIASTFFIWMIFSLTIDHLLKKRARLSLGIRKYSLRDHVIVCGLGRVGYFIVTELLEKGEKVIVIDTQKDSSFVQYFRARNVPIYIGDARLPNVLADAGVIHAKAVMSVINNDAVNLEIGLNARSFQPKLRLILRIFDEIMARDIKEYLDIHLTLSTSAIADNVFVEMLHKK